MENNQDLANVEYYKNLLRKWNFYASVIYFIVMCVGAFAIASGPSKGSMVELFPIIAIVVLILQYIFYKISQINSKLVRRIILFVFNLPALLFSVFGGLDAFGVVALFLIIVNTPYLINLYFLNSEEFYFKRYIPFIVVAVLLFVLLFAFSVSSISPFKANPY